MSENILVTPGWWNISYDVSTNSIWLVVDDKYLIILDHDNIDAFLTYLDAPDGALDAHLLHPAVYVDEYDEEEDEYYSYRTNDPYYVKDLSVVSAGACKIAFTPDDEGELKQISNDLYAVGFMEAICY